MTWGGGDYSSAQMWSHPDLLVSVIKSLALFNLRQELGRGTSSMWLP